MAAWGILHFVLETTTRTSTTITQLASKHTGARLALAKRELEVAGAVIDAPRQAALVHESRGVGHYYLVSGLWHVAPTASPDVTATTSKRWCEKGRSY